MKIKKEIRSDRARQKTRLPTELYPKNGLLVTDMGYIKLTKRIAFSLLKNKPKHHEGNIQKVIKIKGKTDFIPFIFHDVYMFVKLK